MSRFSYFVGILALGVQLAQAKVVDIESHQVKKVYVSDEGLTRISIQDDSIQDIFAFPSESTDSFKLHQSGNVFLAPQGLEGPVALTVISASGLTQDLLVHFVKKQPEPLILRGKKEERISSLKLERWLTTVSMGETPSGFRWVTPRREKRITSSARAYLVSCYENNTYELSKWELEIHEKKEQLDARSFLNEDEAGKLFYREGTPHLVVIKKREKRS